MTKQRLGKRVVSGSKCSKETSVLTWISVQMQIKLNSDLDSIFCRFFPAVCPFSLQKKKKSSLTQFWKKTSQAGWLRAMVRKRDIVSVDGVILWFRMSDAGIVMHRITVLAREIFLSVVCETTAMFPIIARIPCGEKGEILPAKFSSYVLSVSVVSLDWSDLLHYIPPSFLFLDSNLRVIPQMKGRVLSKPVLFSPWQFELGNKYCAVLAN